MADYTLFTEIDPNSRITITSATRIDYAGIARNESAYHTYDMGAGFYSGDFQFDVDVVCTSDTGGAGQIAFGYPWGVCNSVEDAKAVITNLGQLLTVELQSSTAPVLVVAEYYNGARYATAIAASLSYGTPYYLKIRRDEAVGTYGTLYLDVYSDAARTSLIETKSVTLHALVDFRYLYAFNTYNDGVAWAQTGYFENLVDYFWFTTTTTDTGTGTDSVSVSQTGQTLTITDTGSGADEVTSVIAAITIGDTGAGSDSILVYNGALYSISDTGGGLDTLVSLAASLAITDSASGADSIYISGIVTPDVILESCHGFAAGYEGQVEYKIVDEYRQIIEDWTAAGVFEVPEDGVTSSYSVKIGRLSQYTIFWRISGTKYKARRTVNLFESNNDAQTSTRLAAADFIAPDNAGIASISTIITLLRKHATNKMTEVDNGNGTKTFTIFDDPPNEGNAIFTYTYTVATTTRAKAT